MPKYGASACDVVRPGDLILMSLLCAAGIHEPRGPIGVMAFEVPSPYRLILSRAVFQCRRCGTPLRLLRTESQEWIPIADWPLEATRVDM